MITAKQARILAEQSDETSLKYIQSEIDPKIRKAATMGMCQCEVLVDAQEAWITLQPDAKQVRVMQILREEPNFFKVDFKYYDDRYVPAGLADDDGKGPFYTNYGFLISW